MSKKTFFYEMFEDVKKRVNRLEEKELGNFIPFSMVKYDLEELFGLRFMIMNLFSAAAFDDEDVDDSVVEELETLKNKVEGLMYAYEDFAAYQCVRRTNPTLRKESIIFSTLDYVFRRPYDFTRKITLPKLEYEYPLLAELFKKHLEELLEGQDDYIKNFYFTKVEYTYFYELGFPCLKVADDIFKYDVEAGTYEKTIGAPLLLTGSEGHCYREYSE